MIVRSLSEGLSESGGIASATDRSTISSWTSGQEEAVEARGVFGNAIGDAEKLRRWAELERSVNAPSLIILRSDQAAQGVVLQGWRLGHGIEGAGADDVGHEWKRREATIYLGADGAVVCEHVWVTTETGAVLRSVTRYESDLALLRPKAGHGREVATLCVRRAARQAFRRCQLFGMFGSAWLESQ